MYDTQTPGDSRAANTPSCSNVTYRLIFVLSVESKELASRKILYLFLFFNDLPFHCIFSYNINGFLIVLKHLFGLRGYATNRIIDVCVCVFVYVCM